VHRNINAARCHVRKARGRMARGRWKRVAIQGLQIEDLQIEGLIEHLHIRGLQKRRRLMYNRSKTI
jgi:hypothetical protein